MKSLILCGFLMAAPAVAGDLPDHRRTPGQADPKLTAARLCAKSFRTATVRDVDESLKRKVYAAYGMAPKRKPCPCEVDHLISLELGGSDAQANLWPQSYGTKPWNAHVKDKLENRLHKLVCAGMVTLKTAQRAIAGNWIAAYRKYIGSKAK